jgi:predicted nucleotidyltransferase
VEVRVRKVLERESDVVFAYIFGSYATGEWREGSDVDVAAYARRPLGWRKRVRLALELEDRLGRGSTSSTSGGLRCVVVAATQMVTGALRAGANAHRLRCPSAYEARATHHYLYYLSLTARLP